MGMLIDGVWHLDHEVAAADSDGRWRRTPAVYRNWIHADGDFLPETGRYHLYAAWNCPWAHRALLALVSLGLQDAISVSFVAPRRDERGWVFKPEDGFVDDLFGARALHEIYVRGNPHYTGRVTVPLLWDKQTEMAVSNESADIVRMLGTAFSDLSETRVNLYPEALRAEIDAWNDRIHTSLNNGVYRAGFAATQPAYDEAVQEVFSTLDLIEERLGETEYLTGDHFTEADLRLFPTLVRFDVGYYLSFKCIRNRLIDFPNLWAYARKLYARPGFAETVRFDVYRRGYSSPNPKRNPHGIAPMAPVSDWSTPLPH